MLQILSLLKIVDLINTSETMFKNSKIKKKAQSKCLPPNAEKSKDMD
jgi:hypothetical protein